MVRVLLFDHVDAEPKHAPTTPPLQHVIDDDDDNPNFDHRFSEALSCYPIASSLASQLDLTSLHDLSRTCRQFRANLLQYRRQLIALTLRCQNENASSAARLGEALTASFARWASSGGAGNEIGRLTSGKVGECARDLVGDCRKCGKINCITKPPAAHTLRGRHRRLCKACMRAPLSEMVCLKTSTDDECTPTEPAPGISRRPCTCTTSVWICSPCGLSLRSADTTYLRGWSWRTRYSSCGGFGAGLGEGVEGVECGRGQHCLAASRVEKEVECDASAMATIEAEMEQARLDGHVWAGNSYTTQEMVGIGGQVRMKVKKMVIVGAVVREHEDERANGDYLNREQHQTCRSWCSWCDRVVPSMNDMQGDADDIGSRASDSPASSS